MKTRFAMSRLNRRRSLRCHRAFTLIEVVMAVGIFALALVAIIALFAPVVRSVTVSADVEAAARVADALRTKLQTMTLEEVGQLFKNSNATGTGNELTTSDNRVDYNIATDAKLLFANLDGTKLGVYSDPVWRVGGRNSDREKFFEIALIRNEALSPKPTPASEEDGTPAINHDLKAPMLGYTARIRWPAFVTDANGTTTPFGSNAGGTGRFDHSKKQVAFFTGSVRR